MRKPEPHIDKNGDRYLNLRQAAALVFGISDKTLRVWAEDGKTTFGFPLDLLRVPVTNHRFVRRGLPPTAKPQSERILINEKNVGDLNEILASIQPIESNRPGSWTDHEWATLEAKTAAVLRRKRQTKFHL